MDVDEVTLRLSAYMISRGFDDYELLAEPEVVRTFHYWVVFHGRHLNCVITDRGDLDPQFQFEAECFDSETGIPLGDGIGSTLEAALTRLGWQKQAAAADDKSADLKPWCP